MQWFNNKGNECVPALNLIGTIVSPDSLGPKSAWINKVMSTLQREIDTDSHVANLARFEVHLTTKSSRDSLGDGKFLVWSEFSVARNLQLSVGELQLAFNDCFLNSFTHVSSQVASPSISVYIESVSSAVLLYKTVKNESLAISGGRWNLES